MEIINLKKKHFSLKNSIKFKTIYVPNFELISQKWWINNLRLPIQ